MAVGGGRAAARGGVRGGVDAQGHLEDGLLRLREGGEGGDGGRGRHSCDVVGSGSRGGGGRRRRRRGARGGPRLVVGPPGGVGVGRRGLGVVRVAGSARGALDGVADGGGAREGRDLGLRVEDVARHARRRRGGDDGVVQKRAPALGDVLARARDGEGEDAARDRAERRARLDRLAEQEVVRRGPIVERRRGARGRGTAGRLGGGRGRGRAARLARAGVAGGTGGRHPERTGRRGGRREERGARSSAGRRGARRPRSESDDSPVSTAREPDRNDEPRVTSVQVSIGPRKIKRSSDPLVPRGRGHNAPRGDTTPCRRVSARDRARGRRRDREVRCVRTGNAVEGITARSARGKGSASTGGTEGYARSAGARASASTGGSDASARSAGE